MTIRQTLFYDTKYTITGYFREGHHGHYIELEISGLRWDIEPDRKQLKLLDRRVRMTSKRIGFKRLQILAMEAVD